MKRIGIMGGTFDPIHIGHLVLGEQAAYEYQLDKVLFMPSGNPPHKQHREGRASNQQRSDMVRLAITDNPHFELSLLEMETLEGYSYTYKTLEYLKEQDPTLDIYFIVGGDSLRDFHLWREPERIAKACHLIAGIRDNVPLKEFQQLIQQRRDFYHGDFQLLHTPNLDISSNSLREMVRRGESIRYYVTDSVLQYIQENGLYKSDLCE